MWKEGRARKEEVSAAFCFFVVGRGVGVSEVNFILHLHDSFKFYFITSSFELSITRDPERKGYSEVP